MYEMREKNQKSQELTTWEILREIIIFIGCGLIVFIPWIFFGFKFSLGDIKGLHALTIILIVLFFLVVRLVRKIFEKNK